MAALEFSAQFGGPTAAHELLPHLRALKRSALAADLSSIPFGKVAFVLRVDGALAKFEFSGLRHAKLDKKGEYLSFDIGISESDISRGHEGGLKAFIIKEILSSVGTFRKIQDPRMKDVDFAKLEYELRTLCAKYESDV